MPAFPARFTQWPRRWRLLAWSVAGVYALYLLAGNIFLNTPLFDLATNRKPQKFVMRTGPAITLLPGHVIAWNVHMRGHVNHTVDEPDAEQILNARVFGTKADRLFLMLLQHRPVAHGVEHVVVNFHSEKRGKQRVAFGVIYIELKGLLEKAKTVLAERVKDVRVTFRLTDSPACLVADEHEMSGHLQRLLKAAGLRRAEDRGGLAA